MLCLAPLCLAASCVKGMAGEGLRWRLFAAYGAEQMCPAMLSRGVPLSLTPNGTTVGRFFPSSCSHEVNNSARTVVLHFGGTGYAWTAVAGRVGFSANTSVEYAMDWKAGKRRTTYVWGRLARVIAGPTFQIGGIENKAVDWAARETPLGEIANTFGQQIGVGQLAQGFTVIHHPRRGDDFSLGILYPPQVPFRPFDTTVGRRLAYTNETTEVHVQQVDFVGPFAVVKADQALFIRVRPVSGPNVEAFVFEQTSADPWREGLQLGAELAPPPTTPLASFPIPAGPEQRHRIKVQPGRYYVVIDNSTKIGTVSPPWNPLSSLGANAATVAIAVELGDERESF
ncbi:MAG: hypothetical protein JW751_03740 [Polyangiaceae bacterium]|nr:hypothetical protein [Polyangiaceae bacterium]